jgi:hypothetical protein
MLVAVSGNVGKKLASSILQHSETGIPDHQWAALRPRDDLPTGS